MDELLFNESLNVLQYIKDAHYNDLKDMQCLEKVSQEYIENILKDYGGRLDVISREEYKKYFQYIKVLNQNKYLTYLDIIIDGERSDLTLICEIELMHDSVVKVVVDDIHVL